MNAKRAKLLRGQAQQLTVGLPARGLRVWRQATNEGPKGEAAINDPETTRGVYRYLKKTNDGKPYVNARRIRITELMRRRIHAELNAMGITPVVQPDAPWPALSDSSLGDVPQ